MIPKQPAKRTPTRPGLGIEEALKRLDSAELQKVREKFKSGDDLSLEAAGVAEQEKAAAFVTPPPTSSQRARVPREDDDDPSADAVPRSDRFETKEAAAAARPRVNSPPATRATTVVGLGSKTHPQSSPPHPQSSPPAKVPSKPPAVRTTAAWPEEAGTGQRRRPLMVDSVGDAATRIARTSARQTAPKVIASQATIASAPIDSRTAFILSLVDGTSDVPGIIDASGMLSEEVIAILARLARLGLISVP